MKLLIGGLIFITGCTTAPIVLTPPRAYLTMPPPTLIPASPVTNEQLAEFMLDLHDEVLECRAQMTAVHGWIDNYEAP